MATLIQIYSNVFDLVRTRLERLKLQTERLPSFGITRKEVANKRLLFIFIIILFVLKNNDYVVYLGQEIVRVKIVVLLLTQGKQLDVFFEVLYKRICICCCLVKLHLIWHTVYYLIFVIYHQLPCQLILTAFKYGDHKFDTTIGLLIIFLLLVAWLDS